MLQIFELDSNKEPVSVLQPGEHTFGRGPLLKCDDRRVSRNHGVLTVTDQTVTITSTHQNPCFYQTANSSTITILPKNNPVDVNDGDKFALLADQFWFRIKLTKDETSSLKTNASCSSEIQNLSSNCVENGKLSPLSYSPAPVLSTDHHDDSNLLQITQITGQGADIPSENTDTNNMNDDNSSDSIDFLQPPQKRAHEVDVESPSPKKAKLSNDENENNEFLSVLEDLKENSMCKSEEEDNESDQNKKEVISDVESEGNNKGAEPKTKDLKEIMSESDDEDNIHVKVKPDTPKKNPYKWKKGDASTSSAQSAHDLELKTMLFSSDEENETDDVNKEATGSSSSKNNNISKDIKLNSNDSSTTNKKDSKEQNKKPKDDENDKTDEDPNVAGTSTSNAKKPHRDRCWYGLKCYRKSGSHLREFSHPGDSDFDSDPEDDRPVCAFGAACYRRNKDHRQEYKHPNKPQKPPGDGQKPKKKTKKADPLKKRTTRKQYNESSEDDYDLKDPFIDDSGSEYEVTSSSDDDSDSDWSGASEEGTKRLLKEAKKFTKDKKKDDDDDNDNDD